MSELINPYKQSLKAHLKTLFSSLAYKYITEKLLDEPLTPEYHRLTPSTPVGEMDFIKEARGFGFAQRSWGSSRYAELEAREIGLEIAGEGLQILPGKQEPVLTLDVRIPIVSTLPLENLVRVDKPVVVLEGCALKHIKGISQNDEPTPVRVHWVLGMDSRRWKYYLLDKGRSTTYGGSLHEETPENLWNQVTETLQSSSRIRRGRGR